jgi:copper(I)-binding protein
MKLLPIGIAAMLALGAMPAHAAKYDVGSIRIEQPWARATPKGATTGAGYMTITNNGSQPDRLTCVSAQGAAKCQIHTMTMEQGVMRMRPVTDGLEIKPGQTVKLNPTGLHMMFMGLKQPLTQGQTEKVTLKFQNAGTIQIECAIAGIGAMAPASVAPGGPGMKMNAPGGMKMDHH